MGPSLLRITAPAFAGAEPQADALSAFTTFLNQLSNGAIPPPFQTYISGASLIVIPKNCSDPSRLRPIAIAVLYRSFVARFLAARLSNDTRFLSHLIPLQYAFGTKNAIKVIIYALRITASAAREQYYVLLKIHLSNALNSLECICFLNCSYNYAPHAARFVHFTYGGP